jgi:outer membrane protein assembly factor BamB
MKFTLPTGDPMMRESIVSFRPHLSLLSLAILLGTAGGLRADDWPQWLGPQRDGVWRETGILDKFPKGGPKVRWRVELGGGYAGPAVADGKVYVTDRILAKGAKNPDDLFSRNAVDGEERVRCLDEKTGERLWEHTYSCKYEISYPCGPRTTPLVAGGKVYTLGAMGDLVCLNARTGEKVWEKNLPKEYNTRVPLWGYSAHPLLDGDKLICLVGGKDSVVVAFDKDTGKEKWKALSLEGERTEIGYCPPMIYTAGGKRQLIIWHPESVNGLNPDDGKLYWSQKFTAPSNMSIPTPLLAGDKLLVTGFYSGAMLLKLDADKPDASVLWKGKGRSEMPDKTDTLHSVMSTPVIKDGYIYGVCSYGELRCLKLESGERVWKDLTATSDSKSPSKEMKDQVRWGNAFLVPQGDRFFLFNEKGDLIIAKLSPKGYEELDRTHILDPTGHLGNFGGRRTIVWSHPAFANKSMYARNDKEIVCVSLAAE